MQTTHKATALKSIHLYVFEDHHEDGSALINYLSLPDNKLTTVHETTIEKIRWHFKNNQVATYISKDTQRSYER